jgi:carboxyl-terminal processing protease
MRRIFHVLAILVLILFTISATVVVMGQSGLSLEGDSVAEKVALAEQVIDQVFVGEYDEEAVGDAAVSAMIASLGDRWSYYVSAEDYAAYEEQMNNSYVGIGVTIQADPEGRGLTVVDVTPDGPADEAGIQVGDILIEVEGQSVPTLGQQGTVALVRGEEGTEVALTLLRGETTYTCTAVRRNVQTVVVQSEKLPDGLGYISIDNFDSDSARQTIAAIDEMVAEGAKGLIFDVRNNPGGMKDELVEILDYLLEDGQALFTSKDYTGTTTTDYAEDGHQVDLPMAVLVNGESYSAAEFFAAALQELDRAVVVGEATCGKGYYQITYPLPDGSAMAISSGEYFTPNGRSLAGVGVTPDEVVTLTDEQTEQLLYGTLEYTDDPQILAAATLLENGK